MKGIIDNEVFEGFIENLKIELLKKSMLVKKEYDNYYDYNDSGFCVMKKILMWKLHQKIIL
jgi:hypothetical protein